MMRHYLSDFLNSCSPLVHLFEILDNKLELRIFVITMIAPLPDDGKLDKADGIYIYIYIKTGKIKLDCQEVGQD